MKAQLRALFEYHHHYSQQLIVLLEENEVSDEILQLFSHILNAQHIWNHRILSKEPLFTVWQVHEKQNLQHINQENYAQTLTILEKADLNAAFSYNTFMGQTFHNKIEDILFHMINHTTYHKGQIALLLKQQGITPIATDYIIYKRNNHN